MVKQVLEEEKVHHLMTIGECPFYMVPLDEDLLSFEIDFSNKDCQVDGDTSCLWFIANAIHKLESSFGVIPYVRAKGKASARVADILSHMQTGNQSAPLINKLFKEIRDLNFEVVVQVGFLSSPSSDTLHGASEAADRLADGWRSLVLVFIGGVTFAEISASRFLSAPEGMAYDLIRNNKYCQWPYLGGAERLIVDAAVELGSHGHNVHIFTAHHDKNRCFEETVSGGYDKRLRENVEYLEELKSLAEREGVSHRVKFVTSCSTAERNALLSQCLCVIYTPKDEHFGIVPLEAMAAHKPVIACNSGGPVETDPQIAKRMGEQARKHATESFSTKIFGQHLNQYLISVAGNKED
ncbi:hypothetical protein GH714_025733 [Hevea brasiliensis]|uniref:Alpha-1,3/1,6-mannosyltransferase ALG2 n=1 Tax=Hevea brasiliensis TaxID=3981 RepID=A0A6A6MPN5_HEVBR|nr:hypothetical protein GH714_025733 [Hevea brasiliensis]